MKLLHRECHAEQSEASRGYRALGKQILRPTGSE